MRNGILAASACLLMSTIAQAAIVVTNPSFENPDTGTYNSNVYDWNETEDGGTYVGVLDQSQTGVPTPALGQQVAYVDARESNNDSGLDTGGRLYQYVGTVDLPDDGLKWQLTVALAYRTNKTAPAYVVGIYADDGGSPGEALGEITGDAGTLPSSFTDYTVTTDSAVSAGLGMWIMFHSVGNNTASNAQFMLVDNVRFQAIPEPATLSLLGLLGAALCRRRR